MISELDVIFSISGKRVKAKFISYIGSPWTADIVCLGWFLLEDLNG